LLLALGAGVLLAVVGLTISAYFDKQASAASDLLFAGVEAAKAPVIDPAQASAEADDAEESFPSVEARAKKAREEFAKTIKEFPNSDAARWAALGDGHALLSLGKYTEAAQAFQKIGADTGLDAYLRASALEGAGFALEAQQKYADAEKRFAELSELDKGSYKPLAEYHRARMQIALGQKQKAAETLEKLVKAERARPEEQGKRFENVIGDAETMLTELSVELNAPKLRQDIAPSAMGGGEQPGGLTQDIIEQLRKQLEQGQGDKGVNKELVEALEKQVPPQGSTAPAPAPANDKPALPQGHP
jgi:tetratricopeptide (TPR) repeat protein